MLLTPGPVPLGPPRALAARPDPTGDPSQLQFFESKIRPIFVNNCYQCHSRQAEKLKANLSLESRESMLKGGETGPAIVPGDPDNSLLIKAVRYTDPDLQMPPKDKPLSRPAGRRSGGLGQNGRARPARGRRHHWRRRIGAKTGANTGPFSLEKSGRAGKWPTPPGSPRRWTPSFWPNWRPTG